MRVNPERVAARILDAQDGQEAPQPVRDRDSHQGLRRAIPPNTWSRLPQVGAAFFLPPSFLQPLEDSYGFGADRPA
jgi:hypothetical protein